MAITTYPLNGITYDAEDAETYLCTRTSGVFDAENNFGLEITGDMEITISPGIAWIKNKDFAGKSICMDEEQSLTLTVNTSSVVRYDRVVLRFDSAAGESTLEILEGDDEGNAPDVTQEADVFELGLYLIQVTGSELSESSITDTRTDSSVCGIMTDGVTSYDGYMQAAIYDPDLREEQVEFTTDLTLGPNASAGGTNAIAIGEEAKSSSVGTIAIGRSANASSAYGISIGPCAAATTYSVTVGAQSTSGVYGTAIGGTANAASRSTAVGSIAYATGANTVAVGYRSNASAYAATALGYNSAATSNYATALGQNATAYYAATAVGQSANATGNNATAAGSHANAVGNYSTAVGQYSYANAESVALGANATANYAYTTAVGRAAYAIGENATALGQGSSSSGTNATALGHASATYGNNATALGQGATATGANTTALGKGATASGGNATALGKGSSATAVGGTALGKGAEVTATYSTALGYGATCSSANTIQLGSSELSALKCATSLTTSSDTRDKTDIEEIEGNATDFLKAVKAIRYVSNFREDYIDKEHLTSEDKDNLAKYGLCTYDKEAHAEGTKKGERIRVGVSAQEVQEALESVYGDSSYANLVNDNLYDFEEVPEDVESQLAVNYSGFIPFLIKAVQELDARIEALEEE